MPATSGRVLSNVCMTPPKPCLVSISGVAEQVRRRHAAVLEAERRRVGGADPELVLETVELEPRVGALDHERLDRSSPDLTVQRRPHDDQVGPLARGDVDLLAVEDVVVAVLDRGRADGGRVRAGLGLGDGHGGPLALEALELLVVGHRGDGRVAQALAGHRQQQADVAPAQLDDAEHRGHVRAVAHGAVAVVGAADTRRPGAAEIGAVVHPVDERGQHVELLGVGVLLLVVLARHRSEDLGGDLMGLVDEAVELLGDFQIDH